MPYYADRPDCLAYTEGLVIDDNAAFDRLIGRAERDVDSILRPETLASNGLKFGSPKTTNEKDLTAGQVLALEYATCAQVEYRLEMGEKFFVKDQYEYVAGPDFERRGNLTYVGPKVLRELESSLLTLDTSGIGMIVVNGGLVA